ncbi:hypothetical protein MSG28_003704 [Choristoneura fumiferana]|uniref:Uncharacterized protein n=1 Tax=Choristoneura fumiferana TaxID=7141 RepID=A0ACC0KFS2_CHOFU|nr:hypothetical protein MSG28_003704 [Choristoneura fumiferana]
MGKTKRHSIDPEYIKKKIRRLQRKLEHQEETSTSPQRSTSPEPITLPPPPPGQQPTQPLPPTQPPPSIANPEQGTSTEGNIEQIPEEFLAALGNEGEEKVEEGEPIQSELATRWMRIMAEGLTKEQIQTLIKKYPTPKNFPAAVAPILNKEIGATLSELSLNRDRRIINRQNMIAKILSCLGMTLTDILKGNINSKKLIEQISDAAKIAAEIHCNDSKSRKFFALSSATKIVQDACKETKTGKLLFGDGLSDQLKTVHIQTFKLERPIALPDNQPKGPRWAETYEASYYQPDTSPPCTNSGETNITESQPATLLDQVHAVPQEKQLKIREKINSFKNKSTCKIRDFAQILGLLNSLCPAIPYGWLYTKILEREKYLALLNSDGNYDNKMSLSTMIFQELDWWLENINKHNLTKTFNFKIEIHTDASNSGWGAVCGTETASGSWSATEKNYHINYLELKAALLGLQCFTSNIHDCEVLLRVDNTTAVAYINKMGGIQFPHLNDVTRQLWKWCESRNIWIYASYVNTKDNIADAESRKINIEWELSKDAYQIIITTFGVPSIDLFASRINTKCKKFISWKRDPEAFAEKPPAAQTTYPGCRAAIGEAYIKRGVPAASVNVMLSSLTTNTYKQVARARVKGALANNMLVCGGGQETTEATDCIASCALGSAALYLPSLGMRRNSCSSARGAISTGTGSFTDLGLHDKKMCTRNDSFTDHGFHDKHIKVEGFIWGVATKSRRRVVWLLARRLRAVVLAAGARRAAARVKTKDGRIAGRGREICMKSLCRPLD